MVMVHTFLLQKCGLNIHKVRKLLKYNLFKQIDLNAKYKKIFQKI